jgi:hemolysin activation/secretion protein
MIDRMAGAWVAPTNTILEDDPDRRPIGWPAKGVFWPATQESKTNFVPKPLIFAGFAVAMAMAATPSLAATSQATAIRAGIHDFGSRVVVDLSAATAFRLALSVDSRHLVVTLPDVTWQGTPSGQLSAAGSLQRYRFISTGQASADGGTLMVESSTPMTVVKAFHLAPDARDGHRLVVDLAPVADAARSDLPKIQETVSGAPRSAALRGTPTQVALARPIPVLPDPIAGPPLPLSDGASPKNAAPVIFTNAVIVGATVFPQRAFLPFYRDLIGKPVALPALKKAAERMTAHYRNAGYVLSQVIVPEQQVASGAVRFQAIEGFIDNVIIEGEIAGATSFFDQWKKKIRETRPLTAAVLERYTLLANDLPGATVKSVLRPAKDLPGASDLILKVEHEYIEASATLDNRASKTTGPNESTEIFGFNSLLGFYDKITLTYNAATDRSQSEYIGLNVALPINAEGTVVSLSGSQSDSAPGDILKDLELTSKTTTVGIAAKHPLIRSREQNFNVSGGFTVTNSKSDALSSRLYEDKLRVANLGVDYSLSDFLAGENNFAMTLSQGLGLSGATGVGEGSRSDGDATFTKLTASAGRLQALPHDFSISAAFSGQWANVPLLSSEEFSYGGSSFGRAYDSSEITGDHGMAVALELQYTARPSVPYLKYVQPYGFWDQGLTWDIDATDDSKRRSGASAGVGVRTAITDYFFGNLEIGWPLTRPVSLADEGEGNDPRFFFSLSAQY